MTTKPKINREYVIERAKLYYPPYGSHGWNHIEESMTVAMRCLKRELSDVELAYIAFHDSGHKLFPKEHEYTSAFIAEVECKQLGYSEEEVDTIVHTILFHRNSSKEMKRKHLGTPWPTIDDEIIACADAGLPNADARCVLRGILYLLEEKEVTTPEETAVQLISRMGDRLHADREFPQLYLDTFKEELKQREQYLSTMRVEDITAYIVEIQHTYRPVDWHAYFKSIDKTGIKQHEHLYQNWRKHHDKFRLLKRASH